MKYLFPLLLLLPLNTSLSQGLPLSGVNGWHLELVAPAPLNVFDTLNTGMQIIPYEEGSPDSAELFKMYAETRSIGEEWGVQFTWNRSEFSQQQFNFPRKTKINVRVDGLVEVEYAYIGVALIDTSGSGFWTSQVDWIEIGSTSWQTIEMIWSNHLEHHVHQVTISFQLMAGDSSYVGTDLLLDSLIFTSESGIDTLVDDFGDYMGGPTSVVEPLPGSLTEFNLFQNYPNPFNPTTKIRYEIPNYSSVRLNIYSLLGEEVAELINKEQPPGINEVDFDGKNLPSGTYIYALSINGQRISSRKMLLIK